MQGGDPRRKPEVQMRLREYSQAVTTCNQAWNQLQAALATISGSLQELQKLGVQVEKRPRVTEEATQLLGRVKSKLSKLNT